MQFLNEVDPQNEQMLADAIEFVWRRPLLRQAVVTGASIAIGYGLGWLIVDGGLKRIALDARDLMRSRSGDTQAEGRLAGRFLGDFLSTLGRSPR